MADKQHSEAVPLMNKKALAGRLSCSVVTVNRLLRNGALSFVRVGRSIRFRESDLALFLSRNEEGARDYQ